MEDKERLNNVQELFNGIRQFCDDETEMRKYDEGGDGGSEPTLVTLSQYIENFTLLSSAEKGEDGEDDNNRISLMTVHSSKGLEYPYIYIAGLEENLFPSGSDLLPGDIEEERRLFYVALTRAKKEVTLTYASARHRYGKEENNLPSRFIKEIDPQYLDGDVPSCSALDGAWGSSGPAYVQRISRPAQGAQLQKGGSAPFSRPGSSSAARPYGPSAQRSGSFSRPEQRQQPYFQRPASGQRPQESRPVAQPNRAVSRTAAASRPTHTPSEGFTPSAPGDIRPGMRVEHNIFGYGRIESMEGSGPNAKAVFVTDSGESKTLILKYAKLRICD